MLKQLLGLNIFSPLPTGVSSPTRHFSASWHKWWERAPVLWTRPYLISMELPQVAIWSSMGRVANWLLFCCCCFLGRVSHQRVGRLRRCLGPLFLLKGSQRPLCSDLKHIKSSSHGCLTFRVSDVCWQIESEMNALTCAPGADWQQLAVSSSHLLQCLCLNMAHGYYPRLFFLFLGALFSELCVNNTSKHSREHFQQAKSHTFAGVKWWIMDFLLKQECKQCSRGREQRGAILVHCDVS